MVSLEYLLKFIEEDAPDGDITSDAILPEVTCHAAIKAEQAGIIAGLEEASALFSHFGVSPSPDKNDGDAVGKGEVVLSLCGSAKKILLVERTALNIIGRMSGIATQTARMGGIVRSINPQCRVAATRKTCPGLRALDKKAVRIGGGEVHRMNLSDGILIKDNHLALVPLGEAIRAARTSTAYKKIEVEVETPGDAVSAAAAGVDIILLDNMGPGQVRETLAALDGAGLRNRVIIELSGGIDETTIGEYAACGVDVISMGALTHTVKNFSINLEIFPEKK